MSKKLVRSTEPLNGKITGPTGEERLVDVPLMGSVTTEVEPVFRKPPITIDSEILHDGTEAGGTVMSATKRPVHPIAELFPMMTQEELSDPATDIKANGLIHPIVVDKDGVLIDGRNRAMACEIAGVEPTTALFDGDDPRAYIISNNISRRHLTKSQQAMAVAMVYPVPEKGGKGKRSRIQEGLDEPRKTFQNRLSQARIVMDSLSIPTRRASSISATTDQMGPTTSITIDQSIMVAPTCQRHSTCPTVPLSIDRFGSRQRSCDQDIRQRRQSL
jgi:hypothetical protein